jgi:O-antigen/teichoic acid export membrane protein
VAKGGAVQIAGQFTQGAVAFLFVALVVRLLGTAEYGLFRQVVQILAIAAQFGLAGFNYAAMRFIAKARASGDPGGVRGSAQIAIIGALISSALVFLALQIGAEAIARRFAEGDASVHEMATLVRVGAIFVPLFALTQVMRYCTQAYKTMVPSVIVGNIIQPIVRAVAAAGLILLGFGVLGAVIGHVIASATALAVGVVLFRRMVTAIERAARPRGRPGAMTRFALLQGGASLLGIQTLGLSVLILGAYGTDRDVGLLGIALALQTPGTLFLGGIVNIWAPVVTDLYERGEIDRLESLYRTITRWVVTFSFPIFAAMILVPDVFVDLLAGGRGEGAAPLVAILAAGNLFYAGTGPTGFLLSMTGRPGINFVNSAVAVALYVGLGIWIVPRHGAIGMAWVDAAVTAVINVVRVVEARLVVGVHPFGRSLLKPLVASAVAVVALGVILAFLPSGTGGAVAALGGAGLVYVGLLKKMGLDAEERQVWEGLKRKTKALRRGDSRFAGQ